MLLPWLILLHHRHNPGSKPQALPSVIYYWPQRCTEVNKALSGLRAINKGQINNSKFNSVSIRRLCAITRRHSQ